MSDHLQQWNAEAERYKVEAESYAGKLLYITLFPRSCSLLKVTYWADRSLIIQRKKELNVNAEFVDARQDKLYISMSKIELEHQLQKCVIVKNEMEIKMEEAIQDSGQYSISHTHLVFTHISFHMQ